jgi:ABC-2 type transport system ATP-binding protein
MKIEVKNLHRSFGTTDAVKGLDFTISSGQVMAFVGPNGAGKTTTMRIMATLDEPTGGDVLIDGTSIIEEPEKARAKIGFVPDSLPVHRDLTVEDYLDFFARANGVPAASRPEVLDGIMAFTNLLGIRNKLMFALSKGMKQRVSLARALIHDPPFLIMDEPAAGLDPRARVELRELLKVLASQGKAVFISSHILSELSEICTGAVIIEQGRLLRSGALDSVVGNEKAVRTVVIHLLGRREEAVRTLLETPAIESARLIGEDIEAEILGEEKESVAILALLIQQGYPVMEFRRRRADLETVFMSVTKGEVQ